MDEIVEQLKKNQTGIYMNRVLPEHKELFNLISEKEFKGDSGAAMRFLVLLYDKYHSKVDMLNVKKVMENGQV